MQLLSLQVAQDGAIAFVDINHIEIQPVRLLIVGVAGRVAEVDLVLAVALVFGIGTGACALYNLLGSEVEAAVIVLVGHRQAGNGRVPIDTAPAQIDMIGVIREYEGRRVCGVVGRGQKLLFSKSGDVARFLGDAVPDFGLVRVAGVEDHHALVGQHHKCRVVVVIGLEVAAHKHIGLAMGDPVVLRSLDVAMDIDVSDISGVDGAAGIFVVKCTRVGEPAPGSFVGNNGAAVGVLGTKIMDGSDRQKERK